MDTYRSCRRIVSAMIHSSLLVVALGSAQQGPESRGAVTERVDVQLVVVDVLAFDRADRPVLDLAPDELLVFDEGEPVAIRSFSAPTASRAEPARRPSSSPQPDRDDPETPIATERSAAARSTGALVVFLDELHLRSPNRKKILKQLVDVLAQARDSGDQVLVVSFDGALNVRLPPTTETDRAIAVLKEEMKRAESPMLATFTDTGRVLASMQQRVRVALESQSPRTDTGDDPCPELMALARTHASQTRDVILRSLAGLRTLVDSLAPMPGRKTLLHISDGIPLTPGTETYAYAIEQCDGSGQGQMLPGTTIANASPGGSGSSGLLNSSESSPARPTEKWSEMAEFNMVESWSALAAYANTSQVSFYTLQASGLQGGGNASVDGTPTTGRTQTAGRLDRQDTLHFVADQTGGRATFNTNDFREAIVEAGTEDRLAYQLGFEPVATGASRPRAIRVETSRDGVRLRFRRSYTLKPPTQHLEDTVLAALLHGLTANPLGTRVEHTAVEAVDKRTSRTTLRIHVPLQSLALLPSDQGPTGSFSVAVGGRDQHDRFFPIGLKTLYVRASEADQQSQAFLYEVEMPLRGESAEVAVVVRDETSGEISSVLHPVTWSRSTPTSAEP